MKAIQLPQHGEPDLLEITELNDPCIENPTEVKVKLKAAGVNPIDTKLRAGLYPINTFPAILGCDGAGIVETCGPDVTRVKEGDEVYFFHGGVGDIQGNYAEYKVLDERFVALKPKSINFSQAAAAPLVLLTAWEALFDRAHLVKDQTVFINAGAGGVGHVAIQLAKHFGAKVCTSVSNKEKTEFVKGLGADFIINYKEQNIVEATMEWTDGKGVDVAMDNVGGTEIQAMFPVIKHYGEMVTLLKPDNTVDWAEARFRNISFNFEVMLSPLLYELIDAQLHQTWILEQCADLIDEGKLQIHVSNTLPLEQAADAHRQLETDHTTGKIVLSIQ
jgi:NADPH:quinone reductase